MCKLVLTLHDLASNRHMVKLHHSLFSVFGLWNLLMCFESIVPDKPTLEGCSPSKHNMLLWDLHLFVTHTHTHTHNDRRWRIGGSFSQHQTIFWVCRAIKGLKTSCLAPKGHITWLRSRVSHYEAMNSMDIMPLLWLATLTKWIVFNMRIVLPARVNMWLCRTQVWVTYQFIILACMPMPHIVVLMLAFVGSN